MFVLRGGSILPCVVMFGGAAAERETTLKEKGDLLAEKEVALEEAHAERQELAELGAARSSLAAL